jgi:HD domain-containing protein
VPRADDLVTTDAERACLAALHAATGETNGPMERHCVRQFLIAERLGQATPDAIDRELLLCAALLHDAGLYPGVSTGDVYVTDSRRLAERTLAAFGWPHERLARCLDAVEQHHALRSRDEWGAEVELIRRSDLIDVTRGLVRFGLSRTWTGELFRSVPRTGLYRMLTREVLRMARERPRTLARIFRPRRSVPTA